LEISDHALSFRGTKCDTVVTGVEVDRLGALSSWEGKETVACSILTIVVLDLGEQKEYLRFESFSREGHLNVVK